MSFKRLRLWWYYWHSIPSYRAYSTMVQDPSEMAFFRTSKISSHSLPPILLNLVLCKSLQDHIRPTANFVHQTQQIMCEWEGDNFYNHTVKLWDLNPWAYWLQPWDIALKPPATTDSEFYHICSRIGQDKTRQDRKRVINLVGPCKSQLCIKDQNTRDYHFWHPWTTSCSKI